MKTCKVYKDLDTQLKIRGLNSEYFFIFLLTFASVGLLVGMSVLSVFSSGNYFSLFEVAGELLIPFGVYYYFSKKSKRSKIQKKKYPITVSNREVYKVLYRNKNKQYG